MANETDMLRQLETLDAAVLTPAQVAPIIGSDPQTLRLMARNMPERMGFPVIVIGSRVKIPRLAFLAYMKGGASA